MLCKYFLSNLVFLFQTKYAGLVEFDRICNRCMIGIYLVVVFGERVSTVSIFNVVWSKWKKQIHKANFISNMKPLSSTWFFSLPNKDVVREVDSNCISNCMVDSNLPSQPGRFVRVIGYVQVQLDVKGC